MGLPHHYLIALVSPAGRLPPAPFAGLAVLLAFGHIWLFGKIADAQLGLTWNPYTIALFAMLWMQFCIFTRRLRDTGSNGAWILVFFFIAVGMFIVALDPTMIWPKGLDNSVGDSAVRWGMRFVRGIYVAGLIYGIRAAGQEGPNAYGPEFGDTDETKQRADDAMTKKLATQMQMHTFDRPAKKQTAWGERKRPAGLKTAGIRRPTSMRRLPQ